MKPSRNSDRQSCASSGELLPKNGTAFATESPTTFVSSRPTSFGSSRRAGITGKISSISARVPRRNVITDTPALSDGRQFQFVRKPLCAGDGKAAHLLQPGPVFENRPGGVEDFRPSILLRSSLLTP